MTDTPSLFQLPGCDQFLDWSPGPSRCCGTTTFVVVRYDVQDGDTTTAIVCPSCRLLTLKNMEWVVVVGSFDLATGEYQPLDQPKSADPNDLSSYI